MHKTDSFAVIDANGVGYKLYTSQQVLSRLDTVGREITLFTHLYVREDMQDLYGFLSEAELDIFLKLISVSGVGPKAALAVMSVMSCEEFAAAVITKDTKRLTKAQGVGPKAAQRIILELKDKLDMPDLSGVEHTAEVSADISQSDEAIAALTALGYSAYEAERAVSRVEGGMSLEDTVRAALKNLMR